MYAMPTKEEWTSIAITVNDRERLRQLANESDRHMAGQLRHLIRSAVSGV